VRLKISIPIHVGQAEQLRPVLQVLLEAKADASARTSLLGEVGQLTRFFNRKSASFPRKMASLMRFSMEDPKF
jgi:hypothetical protein